MEIGDVFKWSLSYGSYPMKSQISEIYLSLKKEFHLEGLGGSIAQKTYLKFHKILGFFEDFKGLS